jgi:uroporphyrin-III C-methyltransferase/precorrin-2 dehydrogenase/sirohydrochlorin ferrochelatase
LLTRTAVARLRAADLVLYDALVDERILKIAGRAQRFFVGKRAGRHALTQEDIHAVMIRAAKRGRRVVRLKGGDPFVFGRGGEEALALRAAGVPFDIVPGVTSAFAAPAAAGIPVTHRGLSAAVLVVSGHDEDVFASAVAALQPSGVTIVVLMGLGRRVAIARCLLDRGWPTETPAAIVADASRPDQQTWRGTIGELAANADPEPGREEGAPGLDNAGPASIVIGAVAGLDLRDVVQNAGSGFSRTVKESRNASN